MILTEVLDPRDQLDKVRLKDLRPIAEQYGIVKPGEFMPAMLIRKKLREKGIRSLPQQAVPQQTKQEATREVDALSLMEQQHEEATMASASLKNAPIFELRKMAKAKGITMPRTAKHEDFVRVLGG